MPFGPNLDGVTSLSSPLTATTAKSVDPESEMLFIWMLGHDGTLVGTLHEAGHGAGRARRMTLPLPAIARTLASTGAACLFMAHSHPSGDPRPSHADIQATRQIWRLARTLGASLQDHLVIGRGCVFSFRDSGLL